MPIYVYTCDECGATEQRKLDMDQRRPKSIRCAGCGGWASRDFHAEQMCSSGVFAAVSNAWADEPASQGLAVHPGQIREAVAHNQRGSALVKATSYDKHGGPKFTSRRHRREYGEHWGAFDRDGGYSDAQAK